MYRTCKESWLKVIYVGFNDLILQHSCTTQLYWYEKPQPLQNLLAFICLLNFLCCWTAHHWVMRSGRRVGAFIMELYLEKFHIFSLAETCRCIVFDRDGLTEWSYRLLCWTFPSRVWSLIFENDFRKLRAYWIQSEVDMRPTWVETAQRPPRGF